MAVVRAPEASSSFSRYTYDVFLSFRGEDVRRTFLDHLYTAMVQARFRTFRDDEIKRGENIKLELEASIRRSRISVVVLSKDYAFSSWCLDELVVILDCRRNGRHVLPVFYHVNPSEVRKQKGQFEEAFRKYEEQFNAETDNEMKRERMDKVKRWREALREVADLAGMDLQNQANGHESNFIYKMVNVQDESASANIYVICGMGGIGKTTIARYIYNLNNRGFGCKSFLANIRETSEQPDGLLGLQKQILSEILKMRQIEVYNVDQGTAMIKDAISYEKVFLVLDDVNEVNQLDALLGTRKFYPGSKIIVTTRDKGLLRAHEVHKVYAVEKLDDFESLELFTQHAFGQYHPLEGYVELSKRVVQHCGGLPLALEVFGSSLYRKSVDAWERKLKKWEAFPDAHILNMLKVSYDYLQDDHDKNLFLHIACFFVGKDLDDTVKILDGCGFFTIIGIQNLTNRCLITVSYDKKLMMHQLNEEMGKEIVYRESPDEPEMRSRLWHHKDSFEVLKKRKGTKAIEGLIFDMRMFSMEKSAGSSSHVNNVKKRQLKEFSSVTSSKQSYLSFISCPSVDASSRHPNEVDLKTDAFTRMKKLKLLSLNYVKLTGSFVDFPRELRWLSWHGFSLKSIPTELSLTKVVALDMSYSRLEQVWDGIKLLRSLKILNLSYSLRLTRTPDFSALPNVEKLIFRGCVSLVEVCEFIGYLKGLTLLDLEDCNSLQKLPNIVNHKSLKTLIISGCSSLRGRFPINRFLDHKSPPHSPEATEPEIETSEPFINIVEPQFKTTEPTFNTTEPISTVASTTPTTDPFEPQKTKKRDALNMSEAEKLQLRQRKRQKLHKTADKAKSDPTTTIPTPTELPPEHPKETTSTPEPQIESTPITTPELQTEKQTEPQIDPTPPFTSAQLSQTSTQPLIDSTTIPNPQPSTSTAHPFPSFWLPNLNDANYPLQLFEHFNISGDDCYFNELTYRQLIITAAIHGGRSLAAFSRILSQERSENNSDTIFDNLKAKLEAAEKEKAEVNQKIETLERLNQSQLSDHAKIEIQLMEKRDELRKQNNQLQQQLNQRNKQNKEQEEDIEKLASQLKKQHAEYRTMITTANKLEKEHQELISEFKKLGSTHQNAIKLGSHLDKEYNTLKEKAQTITDEQREQIITEYRSSDELVNQIVAEFDKGYQYAKSKIRAIGTNPTTLGFSEDDDTDGDQPNN